MSTRSGKRIHGSLHENIVEPSDEMAVRSERKTRSKRLKPLKENEEVVVPKSKKRSNYVSYPIDDDAGGCETQVHLNGDTLMLKEQDLNILAKKSQDSERAVRQTRRTKKLSENLNEDNYVAQVVDYVKSKKSRKNKKKKENVEIEVNEIEIPAIVQKKPKKKKGKKINSFTEEEIVPEISRLNKTNDSLDSFHSAAGSPEKTNSVKKKVKPNSLPVPSPRRGSKRLKADSCEDIATACLSETVDQSSKKIKLSNAENNLENKSRRSKDNKSPKESQGLNRPQDTPAVLNGTYEKESRCSRKSSIKNSTFDKIDTPLKVNKKLNSSVEISAPTPTPKKVRRSKTEENKLTRLSSKSVSHEQLEEQVLNSTFDKSKDCETILINEANQKSKKSHQLNSTFEKSLTKQASLNSTFEKSNEKQSTLNSTYEKIKDSTFDKSKEPETLNSTFERNNRSRRSLNTTFDGTKEAKNSVSHSSSNSLENSKQSTLNSTFEKSENSDVRTLNSTFEKETKLNSTYEKAEDKSGSSKSSLISSDSASNVTLDKSDENSRISITSDDSRTENIVNTTPVLIESSMDESLAMDPTPPKTGKEEEKQPSLTPLKREGTFTKDGPDVVNSPKVKITKVTPKKRMSLPSPGSTPFPFSKSSQKEKCMLNVTRSIEKASRRSSLAGPAPRTPRVMFCSPVGDPVLAMQQKKTVIKSSMKGSNKSFVVEDSAPAPAPVRPASRKRSYTQSDAEDSRAKRARAHPPAARPARPRTVSAVVKPSEPVTPRKSAAAAGATPGSRPARTKLPDFAALHQRRFDKMESLDDCQRRRARRAQQLLSPVTLKPTTPAAPAGDPVKSVKESAKKTETPTKTPKLPTLMSLRPGYTRFGFKMDLGVNPFSVPPKPRPGTHKPPALTRQPTLPSLAGVTTSRKDVAKATIMREKSFTSLSDKRKVARTENRSVIKGVRTNRRFELQMAMRNVS